MKTLATKLRLDRRYFGSRTRGAVIGLIFWVFIFAVAVLNVLSNFGDNSPTLLGDYFAYSLLLFSAAFVLAAVADLIHTSVPSIAIALRSVSALAILVAGVVFLVGGIYTTSGPENVAVIVGIFIMIVFGVPYLLRDRDKRQDQS